MPGLLVKTRTCLWGAQPSSDHHPLSVCSETNANTNQGNRPPALILKHPNVHDRFLKGVPDTDTEQLGPRPEIDGRLRFADAMGLCGRLVSRELTHSLMPTHERCASIS